MESHTQKELCGNKTLLDLFGHRRGLTRDDLGGNCIYPPPETTSPIAGGSYLPGRKPRWFFNDNNRVGPSGFFLINVTNFVESQAMPH